MSTDEFLKWLGLELQKLGQIPINLDRFDTGRELVNCAMSKLMSLPPAEQKEIINEINRSHLLGRIGDYQLPFDIRDDIDMVGEVLTTIESILY